MPVLGSSAYADAEDVLNRIRLIVNDSEVAGGDVLTDTAPFSFELINLAYESIALELTTVGDETFNTEGWLIGLPALTALDPEARLIVDDSGSNIIYPNGVGNLYSNTPQLPTDLITPLKLWERSNGTSNFAGKMMQPNGNLLSMLQQSALIDWQWKSDGLRFRGATQVQDVKIEYLKQLPQLAAPTDPVPIRGVVNTAAYRAAEAFAESRGGAISPNFKLTADEEIFSLKLLVARRKQRKQIRRKPYTGRGGRQSPVL
jgi:hypothetical protein